ncbi:arginyl-tRNA-protein transferase [Stieleria maiorica]|uniref:Arginyl-tRNA-protein transferase n=1 Tax=Stieleria maiorica TaxID=2795974 RepID=A0A5B9MIU0_9BACT|nr:arginyltransferase [Stieleria maiorica]QEF99525.1 arginyl-tRNA-protein transferase [Stieleria maiorica]
MKYESPSKSSDPLNRIDASEHDFAKKGLVVVYDSLQECPYLDGKVARMPLEYPKRRVSPDDLDRLLRLGYRRAGTMLYRTQCPDCNECIATRVDVRQFRLTRSMKRILNRSDRELEVAWGRVQIDAERLRLFNGHRAARQLSQRGPADLADYHEFLVATCVETAELTFRLGGKLIGISIVDLGRDSLNAVYTHFDPVFGRYCIGTLAVLKQIQWAIETERTYVYLGLFVAENRHLNYKERFRPQQRLLDGVWQTVAEANGPDAD